MTYTNGKNLKLTNLSPSTNPVQWKIKLKILALILCTVLTKRQKFMMFIFNVSTMFCHDFN